MPREQVAVMDQHGYMHEVPGFTCDLCGRVCKDEDGEGFMPWEEETFCADCASDINEANDRHLHAYMQANNIAFAVWGFGQFEAEVREELGL